MGPLESRPNFADLMESGRESTANNPLEYFGSVTRRWALQIFGPNFRTAGLKFTIYELNGKLTSNWTFLSKTLTSVRVFPAVQ